MANMNIIKHSCGIFMLNSKGEVGVITQTKKSDRKIKKGFCKGGQINGEKNTREGRRTTAERELFEEVGLRVVQYLLNAEEYNVYTPWSRKYNNRGKSSDISDTYKKFTYLVAIVNDEVDENGIRNCVLQNNTYEKIDELNFYPINEVEQHLTYDYDKEVLSKIYFDLPKSDLPK